MNSIKAKLLTLKSQLITRPTPAAKVRADRIAALPKAQRKEFHRQIHRLKFGHKKAVEDHLLQAEWDSGLVNTQDLHAIIAARTAKAEPWLRLRVATGRLKLCVEGVDLRLRFYVGRHPRKSLVVANHAGAEGWKMVSMPIDLMTFIREIENPRPKTEPWRNNPGQHRRGRIGSLPVGWSK